MLLFLHAKRFKHVIGIVVGFLLMGVVNLYLWQNEIDKSPLRLEHTKPDSSIRVTAVQSFKVGDLRETPQRPIFSPDRQDFIAPPQPVSSPPEVKTEPALTATESSPPVLHIWGTRQIGSQSSALIGLSENAAPEWLKEGAMVEGWRITSIDSMSVFIAYGPAHAVYHLYSPDDGSSPHAP